MRITDLEVTNFRGFQRTQKFDVDADAVILVAPNGRGKTSFFDAILWGISGEVPRLGSNDSNLLSLYSDTGQMQVKIGLRAPDGTLVTIDRTFDGREQFLAV